MLNLEQTAAFLHFAAKRHEAPFTFDPAVTIERSMGSARASVALAAQVFDERRDAEQDQHEEEDAEEPHPPHSTSHHAIEAGHGCLLKPDACGAIAMRW